MSTQSTLQPKAREKAPAPELRTIKVRINSALLPTATIIDVRDVANFADAKKRLVEMLAAGITEV